MMTPCWFDDETSEECRIAGRVCVKGLSFGLLGGTSRDNRTGAMSGYEIQDWVYGMFLKFRTRRVLRVFGDQDLEAPGRVELMSKKFTWSGVVASPILVED
jgi:hypothetical protein